jgi:photosystem II stability/assembly factor-like uncharacterized protein
LVIFVIPGEILLLARSFYFDHAMTSIRFVFRLYLALIPAALSTFVLSGYVFAQPTTSASQIRTNAEAEDNVGDRERFFYDRLTSGEIKNVEEIHRRGYESFVSMDNRMAMKDGATPTWQSFGTAIGGYSSGRIRSIVFDPTDHKVAYVAATVGGLWKTNDYSADSVIWQPLADNLPTLVCTCIAIPQQQPKTIYLGTGETYPGYVASAGRGVFKSTDGGLNWVNILPSSIMGPTCSQIAIDPRNPSSIYVAAPGVFFDLMTGVDTLTTFGLFHSMDGGATWVNQSATLGIYPVSVLINPANSNNMVLTGFNGEVFQSTDAGADWISTQPSYLNPVVNPVVAVAPSSPNVLYMSATTSSYYVYQTLYQSLDSGASWTYVSGETISSYEGYNNAIAVDLQDPNHLFVGGVEAFESSDGGQTFIAVTDSKALSTNAKYSHADVHCLVFHDGLLFSGNDGGLSWHNANGWNTHANANLPTLEFVGIDADEGFTYFIGGAQDNGTLLSKRSLPDWYEDRGGDGGNTWVSPLTGARVFAMYTRTNIYRSDDSCVTWNDGTTFRSLITNNSLLNESAPFYPSYDASPDGSVVAFAGYKHVYISLNAGTDGFAVESTTTVDSTTSVRVSPYNATDMWAGANSCIYYSTNEGRHWTRSTIAATGQVVGLVLGSSNATVYAVVAGLSKSSNENFVKSTDGGMTWTTPATNFPGTPTNCLARASSGQLFVGTDYGVITSTDEGATWTPFGLGMPRVQVLSLKVKGNSDQYLLAGTHGRGAYWISLAPLDVEKASAPNFSVGECYPNPLMVGSPQAAELAFTLDKSKMVTATLYDCLGHSLQVLTHESFGQGTHTLQIPTSSLAQGDYFIAVQTSSEALVRKMSVVR